MTTPLSSSLTPTVDLVGVDSVGVDLVRVDLAKVDLACYPYKTVSTSLIVPTTQHAVLTISMFNIIFDH